MDSAQVAADVSAINELRDSLDEESLSALVHSGDQVAFSVLAPQIGTCKFSLVVGSPSPSQLVCDKDVPGLEVLNAKLAAGCSLGRMLALLGRRMDVDLDWVEEATGGSSSDDERMPDRGSDEEYDAIREWSRRLVHMERVEKEAEARDEEQARQSGATATSVDALENRQIFDTRAGFRRLVNELEEIFRAESYDLMAEADEQEGLFQWDVQLAGFRPGSALAEDMQQVGRAFGLSSVQLQLSFKRGLHPFYPPAVRLVSPRFGPGVLAAVECHPLLSAAEWDPMLTATNVLLEIKTFLEDNARVDVSSERNRLTGARASSYTEAEHLLARLQALTGVAPAAEAVFRYKPLPTRPAAPAVIAAAAYGASDAAAHKRSRSNPPAWKAGTGYGTSRGDEDSATWDARRSEAVQAARDAEACGVLTALAAELQRCLALPPQSPDLLDLLPLLRSGCLAPLLVRELSNASFQDMAVRHGYFRALVTCADALCVPAAADVLTTRVGGSTVAAAVGSARMQAEHFSRVYAQSRNFSSGAAGSSAPARRRPTPVAGTAAAALAGDSAEADLAQLLIQAGDRIATATSTADAPAAGPPAGEEARYCAALSQYRVRIVPGVAPSHKYHSDAQREAHAPTKQRARRVGRELASMECDLPITTSSSVFVVADEANSMLWKAIITGPKGTPYEGGAFLFDIYFGSSYPATPPKVVIRTTGGGRVRFNPNLYDDGKVCLSLLGTWSGGKGESWNSEYSTILQVLVSIQSLILVDEPFYNEPGFEQHTDAARSNAYSAEVMENTVRWGMLDQLRAPPAYFADCIRAHFKERGDAVLATVRGWVDWCKAKGHPCQARNINDMLPGLEACIRALDQEAA